jgi:hypothetical protein
MCVQRTTGLNKLCITPACTHLLSFVGFFFEQCLSFVFFFPNNVSALCSLNVLGSVVCILHLLYMQLTMVHCRFIFCRAVLFYFHLDEHEQRVPTCLPSLPESVSPNAEAIKTPILLLAESLVVSDRFHFQDSTRNKK